MALKRRVILGAALAALSAVASSVGCRPQASAEPSTAAPYSQTSVAINSPTLKLVINAAVEQTEYTVFYDPAYVKLRYPGGDVPRERGVCSDVIVRAFRKAGVDLQKEVHEDMKRSFSAYPQKWGLRGPDPNIDHRRVPNLMTFFRRVNKEIRLSSEAADYLPGDVVAWDLGNGLLHIGIVSNVTERAGTRFNIVHNIGSGARIEDVLFSWKIIGHYRYFN
ncbi:MAG TPA: DUF1287 domain-containing protein [Blastocatellia bacterium]|jgi:hypothetical protein|nr:DUF1287 domain-containing protein [Blastocatellia bacterium]